MNIKNVWEKQTKTLMAVLILFFPYIFKVILIKQNGLVS